MGAAGGGKMLVPLKSELNFPLVLTQDFADLLTAKVRAHLEPA